MKAMRIGLALTLLAVLVAACSSASSDDDIFDFAADDLCEWLVPEDLASAIASVYTTHGITPVPSSPGFDCDPWPDEFDEIDTFTGLQVLSPHQQQANAHADEEVYSADRAAFERLSAVDSSIRVRNLSAGCHAYVPGVYAELMVDGHDEILEFFHLMPRDFEGGCNGDVVNPVGLAVAESILRGLGWVN